MREFELLRQVYAANTTLGDRVPIPPGDDMALVRLQGRNLLVAVDQVVAGRHVRLETTPLELVGRKAVTRSLSDIAAMAGRPVAALAAVALPPDFGDARAITLFESMRSTAAAYDCPLVGGDIAIHGDRTHPLTCSVTVLAEPLGSGPVLRSGARVGDTLFVTGRLGGSVQPDGGGRHLTFEPRLAEATELLEQLGERLHAMIDISDGLGRDAAHIAEDSSVRIEIDVPAIPCHADVQWKHAAGDGEDYELLFAADGRVPETVGKGVPVTAIGRVVARAEADRPLVVFRDGNERIGGDELGWEHHASE